MAEGHVYILHHVHPETDRFEEDWKVIGIYSTERGAEHAVERVRDRPGFRDHPDGFTIDAYPLDRDGWVEGYVRVE